MRTAGTGTRINIAAGCKIATSVVELWECSNVELQTDITLGTVQVDVSAQMAVTYGDVDHLGQLVQAGVDQLEIKFVADSVKKCGN